MTAALAEAPVKGRTRLMPKFNKYRLAKLEKSMAGAKNYPEWHHLAEEHDELSGKAAWRGESLSRMYDAAEIKLRQKKLAGFIDSGEHQELLFALNEGIHGNMGGMGRPGLYQQAKSGTYHQIDNYVETIVSALKEIFEAPESEIPYEEKLDFFRRASHCYGRSALMMSGGAGLVYYHHGVVNELIEQDLLPNVLSGSSAGSLMCAQIGSRNDEELKDYFTNKCYDTVDPSLGFKDVISMARRGETDQLCMELVDGFIDDMTFQEAFEHTGRYINISVSPAEKHQTSRLLNAITSPNVTIRSAARASCAVPGLFKPVSLEAKDSHGRIKPYLANRRWVDGSMAQDLPGKRLSRLFGVNHFMVSMINPAALLFVGDGNEGRNVNKAIGSVTHTVAVEAVKASERLFDSDRTKSVAAATALVRSLMDQSYSGDINFVLSTSDFRWKNMIFNFANEKERNELVTAGARSVWPKMEQIRNATVISRELDRMLRELEHNDLAEHHAARKEYMTYV